MRIYPYVVIYLSDIYCSPDAIFSLSLVSSIVHSPFALVIVVASLRKHKFRRYYKEDKKIEMVVYESNILVSIQNKTRLTQAKLQLKCQVCC